MFHRIRLLLMAAVLAAVFMCTGTAVWADTTISETLEPGVSVSEASEPDVSVPAVDELTGFGEDDPAALSDEDGISADVPDMTIQSVLDPPDLNDADPIELPDGYWMKANIDHLVFMLYYSPGCEPTLVYEKTNKEPPATMRYTYSVNGSNIKLYRLVKGQSYLLHKRSKGDSVRGGFLEDQVTLKNKKPHISVSMLNAENTNSTVAYFKVKVPSNGTIRLNVDPYNYQQSSYVVWLSDSNKKDLYPEVDTLDSSVGNKTIFGVKKGTYYIEVATKGKGNDPMFRITSTFQKRSITKAGTSKKKAKTIKLGQKVKGILYYGKNTNNWYKVKISQAGTYIRTGNRELGWGGLDRQGGVYYQFIGCSPVFLEGNRVELKKGTLYIKVYGSGNVNGYYDFTLTKE